MTAQYALAGEVGALVIGTDHAAENVTAFFTKWGDGAADILPLAGLNKRQGAQLLAVPTAVPTAACGGVPSSSNPAAPSRRMIRTASGGARCRNGSSTASSEPSRRSTPAARRCPAARSRPPPAAPAASSASSSDR